MKKGFTLVELLAVIVILAILMVSAGAGVMATMNNSKINTFKNEALAAANAASNMYSDISMNSERVSAYFKTDKSGSYQAMCVTLAGLVNNGYLDKDISTYGGVILVEVPFDGSGAKYMIWMHNSQYGINGIEKNYINKLKFKKDNNGDAEGGDTTSASEISGGKVGIVTNLGGINKVINYAQTANTTESDAMIKGNAVNADPEKVTTYTCTSGYTYNSSSNNCYKYNYATASNVSYSSWQVSGSGSYTTSCTNTQVSLARKYTCTSVSSSYCNGRSNCKKRQYYSRTVTGSCPSGYTFTASATTTSKACRKKVTIAATANVQVIPPLANGSDDATGYKIANIYSYSEEADTEAEISGTVSDKDRGGTGALYETAIPCINVSME